MLSSSLNGDSYMAAGAGLSGQSARKRHRARHHKSRLGCFSCKSRRVKVSLLPCSGLLPLIG
ncbi:hypothetical protein BJX61DRAFT_511077 [Aspergillus egyptiacus]|nr:hypothetical protein BJX61DRAFT_511077 [Aspergillus egyptiacus]